MDWTGGQSHQAPLRTHEVREPIDEDGFDKCSGTITPAVDPLFSRQDWMVFYMRNKKRQRILIGATTPCYSFPFLFGNQ